MSDKNKEYTEGDLTVVWKPDICIHAGHCAKNLSSVFMPGKRPWIDMKGADKEAIIKQINQCPSGALSYRMASTGLTEKVENKIVDIEVFKNGPLAVKSECLIKLPNGEEKHNKKVSFFCRCGASSNKPFCDGSHKKIEFED